MMKVLGRTTYARPLMFILKLINGSTKKLITGILASFAPIAIVLPTIAAEENGQKTQEAIEFLKSACASGDELEIVASGDGGISLMRKGKLGSLEGSAKYKKSQLRGVISDLQGEMRIEENENIRKCMEPRIDRILDVILQDSSSIIRSYDFNDIRLSLDYAGVPVKSSRLVSEWTVSNNTNQLMYVLLSTKRTSVMVRAQADAVRYSVQGITSCSHACAAIDVSQWTLIQPKETIKYRVTTPQHIRINSPNRLTINTRLYIQDKNRSFFRDFSFANIKI